MLIVQVHIYVKDEYVNAFKEATIENAKNSVRESGIARFDVLQQQDDPSRFLLIEVYRDNNAPVLHKETKHYAKWRDSVISMMKEPRYGIRYENVFPGEDGW